MLHCIEFGFKLGGKSPHFKGSKTFEFSVNDILYIAC